MTKNVIPPTPSTRDYTQRGDYAAQAKANATPIFDTTDPIALFKTWMAEARQSELNDSNAMSLATVDSNGMPDVRLVLLKSVDEDGFVFYTNAESAKGQQLAAHPKAALCFHWKSLRRQVRVRGTVTPVSEAESDAYFKERARGSQVGAWASDQSRPVASRDVLEQRVKDAEARFDNQDVPRPDNWFGWRVVPVQIEFWRDRPFRLHDRLEFIHKGDMWNKRRLYP